MFVLLDHRQRAIIASVDEEEEDIEEESSDEFAVFLVALCISHWPFDLERPFLHSSSLPIGSINQFGASADSSSLESLVRLDRTTFDYLLAPFASHYQSSFSQTGLLGRAFRRKLTPSGCLVLALYFLSHAPSLASLCLFTGCVMSTTSKYLHFSLRKLLKVLHEVDGASLDPPSHEYMMRLVELSESVMGSPCMKGCIMVVDGSLHALEKDAKANTNFFYDEYHPDYNGWKGCYCKKGMFFLQFVVSYPFHRPIYLPS